MDAKITVEIIFLITCIVTIYLILRRPYFYIRLGARNVKIDTYLLGVLVGPVLIVILGVLNYSQILRGLQGEGGLNPFGVLVLFLSIVFMGIFLDITGFFEYCAQLAIKFAGNDGRKLYFSLYIIISVLTIFASNDIIILTFTPFIYYFSKNVGIDPKPYLIAEFFAANTWSMMLYIGNPTNIVLATAFNLRFDEYLIWMFLPSIAAGITNMMLLYFIFRKKICQPISIVKKINPLEAITDKLGAFLGLAILCGFLIALAIGPYFGIQMWTISIVFALALLIILLLRDSFTAIMRKNIEKKHFSVGLTLKKMPIGIIPFVLALFITVEALRVYGITEDIGIFFKNICGSSNTAYIYVYGMTSAFSSNLLNNIPLAVAYVPIASTVSQAHVLPAVLATAVGSNLGANITPIGALAGIMWISILRNKGVKISFKEFVKYGLIVTPITLAVCLGILALEFMIF